MQEKQAALRRWEVGPLFARSRALIWEAQQVIPGREQLRFAGIPAKLPRIDRKWQPVPEKADMWPVFEDICKENLQRFNLRLMERVNAIYALYEQEDGEQALAQLSAEILPPIRTDDLPALVFDVTLPPFTDEYGRCQCAVDDNKVVRGAPSNVLHLEIYDVESPPERPDHCTYEWVGLCHGCARMYVGLISPPPDSIPYARHMRHQVGPLKHKIRVHVEAPFHSATLAQIAQIAMEDNLTCPRLTWHPRKKKPNTTTKKRKVAAAAAEEEEEEEEYDD